MSNTVDIRRPQPIFLNLSPTIPGMEDLSRYAMRTHTHKSNQSQAGTWEVELAPAPGTGDPTQIERHDMQEVLYQSIRPQDVVIIGNHGQGFDDNDHYAEQHWMIGFVDNVYRSKTKHNGRVHRSVKVRGRDFTKLFLVDNIISAPELSTDEAVKKAFDGNEAVLNFLLYMRGNAKGEQIFINKYIPQVAYWILENAPSMRIKLDYFEGKTDEKGMLKPSDIFKAFLLGRVDEKVYDAQMSVYAGSILNYFQSIIDSQFYEFWIDTLPYNAPGNDTGKTRPIMILRPKPYDYKFETVNARGQALRNDYVQAFGTTQLTFWGDAENKKYNWQDATHPITYSAATIPDDDILDANLGVTDEEIFTIFRVGGSKDALAMGPTATLGLNFPLLDATLMKAFGLRELTVQSRLIPPGRDVLNQLYKTKTGEELPRQDRQEFAESWGIPLLKEEPKEYKFPEIIDLVKDSKLDKLQGASACRVMSTEKRDRLWRWNRYNHLFQSGTLRIKGRNVFAGQKIILPDEETRGFYDTAARERATTKGIEAYCVAVDQYGGWAQSWITQIAIARGANMSELEQYYKARKFDGATGAASGVFSRETEGTK